MSDKTDDNDNYIYNLITENKKAIIFSFIIVFIIIFVIVVFAGVDGIIESLKQTDLRLLALSFVIKMLVIVLWAFRWKFILSRIDHNTNNNVKSPNFFNVFGILLTSIFGNNITPGSIGGEPLRAFVLNKYNKTPVEVGFASTLVDRVLELLPFIIMTLVAVVALISWDLNLVSKSILIILIIATISGFSLILYAGINKEVSTNIVFKILHGLESFISKIYKNYNSEAVENKAKKAISNFNSSFKVIISDKQLFFVGALLALFTWGLDIFNFYICFLAIGITPPIAPFVTVLTIAILLSFLPLLPGALGITEIIMIALFAPVGITADYVLAASTIERITSYIFPTVLGILATFYYSKKLSKDNASSKTNSSDTCEDNIKCVGDNDFDNNYNVDEKSNADDNKKH
ncbi:MAG: UPF0104 family protein [Methanobacteriaceae archaeon]